MNCESWVREKRKQAQHMAARLRKYADNTDDMTERIRKTAEADVWRMEAGDMQEILASADDADHSTGHGLTVERLLCAFYNVNPSKTRLTLKNSKDSAVIVSATHWSVVFLERFGGLIVNDFEIDGLGDDGFIHELTMYTMEGVQHE
nr:MAG TPA: hypothetical protein [Caudoviricetes sp.]